MEIVVPSDKPVLGTLGVSTKNGDKYVFPAMDKVALQAILPKGSDRPPANTPTLCLVNASYAVLTIPFQIIATISVDEEEWFKSPT